MRRMPPAEARLLKRGQERICGLAAALVEEAAEGCPVSQADCRSRAEDLVAFLSLQARDEHHALDRPAA